jgi:hypothetical protein
MTIIFITHPPLPLRCSKFNVAAPDGSSIKDLLAGTLRQNRSVKLNRVNIDKMTQIVNSDLSAPVNADIIITIFHDPGIFTARYAINVFLVRDCFHATSTPLLGMVDPDDPYQY